MKKQGILRRRLLLAGAAAGLAGPAAPAEDRLAGKHDLIGRRAAPLALEAPPDSFFTEITQPGRFYVSYNLPKPPGMADLKSWALKIGGDGAAREVVLSMADLRAMPQREIVAVCQNAGNRRALAEPKVPGVQWGQGGMGCARWRGVRLRDVLQKVGVKPEAVEMAMTGADSAANPDHEPFTKSLPIERAMDAGTLIALDMNASPLRLLNGYPARIIRPGWAGTYWVKHVTSLQLRTSAFAGRFMSVENRLPTGLFPVEHPFDTQEDGRTSPVTELVINSLVTNVVDGDTVQLAGLALQGLAWDNGSGVQSVSISLDGGTHWKTAVLGPDSGRFAFRRWRFAITGVRPGVLNVLVRATGNDGQLQGERRRSNPGGYLLNKMQRFTLTATA